MGGHSCRVVGECSLENYVVPQTVAWETAEVRVPNRIREHDEHVGVRILPAVGHALFAQKHNKQLLGWQRGPGLSAGSRRRLQLLR